MGAPTIINSDLYVNGSLSAKTATLPAGSITDAMIAAAAGIQASKLTHQGVGLGEALQLFGPTTTVTALTQTLFMARAAGTLLAFGAWIEVQATGADRTITVDLQKSTGGGAYATVLSVTVAITNATVIRTLTDATISSTAYVAGDIFRAVVTVAGAAGAQATGLSIQLNTTEAPI